MCDGKFVEESLSAETGHDAQNVLRPRTLASFIGQETLKLRLGIAIRSALVRGECVAHTLFFGGPGLGKTTLAEIVANEMGGRFKAVIASSVHAPSELLYVLLGLEKGDVLFLDEIHALDKKVATTLYDAMENNRVSVVVDGGVSSRPQTFNIPHFTLVAATTHPGMLDKPFRDRFRELSLALYTPPELVAIVTRSAQLLDLPITASAAEMVASRSRGTPRIANGFIREIRDFYQAGAIGGAGTITPADLDVVFDTLLVDAHGLDATSRLYLQTIADRFAGGPVGLNSLGAAINQTPQYLEDEVEPWLIQSGYVNRTRTGRQLTVRGADLLRGVVQNT